MVKIRVHGIPEEVESVLQRLRSQMTVLSESEPYADRGKSQYVRVYLDVEGVTEIDGQKGKQS